jgi:division protein CdvB (Snf7/Vps24/ESCRT-III family)
MSNKARRRLPPVGKVARDLTVIGERVRRQALREGDKQEEMAKKLLKAVDKERMIGRKDAKLRGKLLAIRAKLRRQVQKDDAIKRKMDKLAKKL